MTKSLSPELLHPKARRPLLALSDLSLITGEDLEVLIKANEQSGAQHTLLGFAVAYFAHKANGVPIKDAICMAFELGLKININWSAKAWHDRHNAFSRVVTLKALSKEDSIYDLATFDDLLPSKWQGYLIRSRRRLGMEGLRQRHCVASYDGQIRRGDTAIAVVFVDRVRWTVQLVHRLTGLAITQVKSRRNNAAPLAVRSKIHVLLGIAVEEFPASHTYVNRRETASQAAMVQFRDWCALLQQHLVHTVQVAFSGSGDEGYIHDVSFLAEDWTVINLDEVQVEYQELDHSFNQGRWDTSSVRKEESIRNAVQSLAYEVIEAEDVDWYNNDGGDGVLSIQVADQTLNLEINQNYTESTCECDRSIDLTTGEDIE